MKYYRLGVVRHNEGFAFVVPDWFLETEAYWVITRDNEKMIEQQNEAAEKNWIALGRPAHSSREIEKDKVFLRKLLDDEQAPYICRAFIQEIDNFVQEGWPVNVNNVEALNLCYDAYYLYVEYCQPLAISNALRDAMFDAKTAFGLPSPTTIRDLDKLGLIRTPMQYDKLSKQLCVSLGSERGYVDIVVQWLRHKKIQPKKYETMFCNFFGKRIVYTPNEDEEKRKLLETLKQYKEVYCRIAPFFDKWVKEFNIKKFEEHCRFDDPAVFRAYPFSDGSRMRPVRRFFKWCLQ